MSRTHQYEIALTWTGNHGHGTRSYSSYGRDHELSSDGRPVILGSADPAFRGDPTRWNPEQLLVAAVAQCHMLWYLHLAADAGISVIAYEDHPCGLMTEDGIRGGAFDQVTLRPRVTITADDDPEVALRLHDDASATCFIAQSMRFPIKHEPVVKQSAGTIRPAMASDCHAMLDVMFSTSMSRESSWWLNTVESLEAKLASGGGFVAEVDDRVVGCVMHVTSGTDLVLRGLAVRPEFGNRGIGTALVEAVEAGARARDLPRVLLAVSASNLEVCDYYLRLGYVVSEEPYAHAAPGRPAPVVFVKQL